jgi:arginyl-tRNA synthetase
MTFRILLNEIRDVISHSLRDLGASSKDLALSEPPRKEYGDVTCNLAFQLSKKNKKRPFDIADEIVEKKIKPYLSERRINSTSFILSVEAHPAGYINFTINHQELARSTLSEVLNNPRFGFYEFGNGKHVTVEHTSVNPNKALHIGHLRNMALGDSIQRILKATNHHITVLNYVDDSGLQVADIIVGFVFAGFPLQPGDRSTKFDRYCGDEVYVKVNDLYKSNPSLEEKRRIVLREMETGTSEVAKYASSITNMVLKEQLKTAWRMKVRYDLLNFESHIIHSGLWAKSFELLKSKGILVFETTGKNIGCWVIRLENEEDKVIIRSDGTTTYVAKDIPYAAWKLGFVNDPFFYYVYDRQWDQSELWATSLQSNRLNNNHPKFNSADVAITVIDARQDRLQRIISKVLSQLHDKMKEYYHLGYESLTLSSETAKTLGFDIGNKKFVHMSGRKGISINADYILDLLHAKAYEEVKDRNKNLSDDTLHEIAEEIAVSAIRYNLIRQDRDKIITFDLSESLSLEGDTGPYLQYAYARSLHIIERSDQNFMVKPELLSLEQEIDLIKQMSKFDLIVEESAKSLDPKLIARYSYDLASKFNLFYEKVPVLKGNDTQAMHSRLALVKAFSLTLKNALDLLGISPLNKM